MPPKGRGRGRGNGGQEGSQQPGRQERPQQPGRQRGAQQPTIPERPAQLPARQGPPAATIESKEVSKESKKPIQVDTVQSLGLELRHKLAIDTSLPRKPKPGTLGRKIKLITNCYKVQLPQGVLYHYDVEIELKTNSITTGKDTDQKKFRCLNTKRNREVVEALLSANNDFQGILVAYDGKKNMYSRRLLTFIGGEYKTEVQMPDENPGNPDDERGPRVDSFQVVIKPVRKKDSNDCTINLDILHELYKGNVVEVQQDAIMALDTIMRHWPSQRFVPVGRNFFYQPDPKDIHPLGGGKEIWFGYHQSLRLGQWSPMVNLNLTATAFHEKGSVLKYIADILRKDMRMLANGNLRDHEIFRLSKELKNLRIETTHLPRYRRKYRILRFTRDSAEKLQFQRVVNGRQETLTIAQYFEREHRIKLQYPKLPCIQGNPEAKRIYLPIEVCEVLAGQPSRKKLDDKQTAEMIKFTAKPPKVRFDDIADIKRKAQFKDDRYLREFGIQVANDPLRLDARVLEPPSVLYKRGTETDKVKPKDGSWDMRGHNYYQGAVIERWVLLNLARPPFCGPPQLEKFARLLVQVANDQGVNINRAEDIITMQVDRRKTAKTILQQIRSDYGANLVVVVVPGRDKNIYGEVKQAAETQLGMVTQCIKDENLVKKCAPPLVSNLCQKINAKMGGVNNALTPNEKPDIMRSPVIFIGADVTHPGPTNNLKPSIAAAVGSLDAHPSRYAVTIRSQTNMNEKKQAVEIILELKSMVVDLLKAFFKKTQGKKPEKIMFYRDGVSEGQFEQVREHEVKCIREACRQLQADYEPGITYVVVQKRHHTRFMPQDNRDGVGKMRNIPPGTTVDNTVVHPLNFDFFLCSHFGLQGTSRPCHYTVIEDDNKMSADDLQKLTYYLCHIYARCTKSISCPAPVMYAHLAAYRAMCHLTSATGADDTSSEAGTATSESVRLLTARTAEAIKVLDNLTSTMYFV